jgi:hypothetical protein
MQLACDLTCVSLSSTFTARGMSAPSPSLQHTFRMPAKRVRRSTSFSSAKAAPLLVEGRGDCRGHIYTHIPA